MSFRVRSFALTALLVAACASPTAPATPISGTEVCTRLSAAFRRAATTCCPDSELIDELQRTRDGCLTTIAPILDDPRVGTDAARTSAMLDEAERRLAACDPAWVAWSQSAEGLRRLYGGTRAIGTSCEPTSGSDLGAILSCIDGFCSTDPAIAPRYVCAPFQVEGSVCTSSLECAPGLFCDTAMGTSTGACLAPRPVGGACAAAEACASGYCLAGHCATPSATHPETLCRPAVAPVTNRGVVFTLRGVPGPALSMLEVSLRVLDATDHQVLLYRSTGLASVDSTFTIPQAVPTGTAYRAQVWTMDPNATIPDMRTWELAVASEGSIAVDVDYGEPQTPLTGQPPPSLDANFDVQFFAFDPELGKTLHVRLFDTVAMRTVAEARLQSIADFDFRVDLPDCIEAAVRYELVLYVDVNGDDVYQPPPTDHAWRAYATAPGSGGLSLPWMWSSAYQDVWF